jgi:molybdopterin-guanine dinucleotide biosynthesis protein A
VLHTANSTKIHDAMRFTGVVLTGGKSTRYGADKVGLFAGAVVAALDEAGADPIMRVGGEGADVADAEGEGPMAGVRAALAAATTDIVVILACDLPDTNAETITAVVEALEHDETADVAVPMVDDHREPLHAAWRKAALSKIDARERAVHKVLATLDVHELQNLDPAAFRNVNHPGD